MKTLILFIALSFNVFSQSLIILMNSDPASTPPSGDSYTTDGLTYNFDWRSLEDGDITDGEWVDSVTGTVAWDVDSDPNKSASYITLDNNDDFIYQGSVVSSGALSFEVLVNITDTTDQQGIFGMQNITASEYGIGLKIRDPDDDILSLCVGVKVAGDTTYSEDVAYGSYINKMTDIIVTWDGYATGNAIKIYINGVLATPTSNYLGTLYTSWSGMIMGYIAGTTSNGKFLINRVYVGKVLSQSEIDANVAAVQGLIE